MVRIKFPTWSHGCVVGYGIYILIDHDLENCMSTDRMVMDEWDWENRMQKRRKKEVGRGYSCSYRRFVRLVEEEEEGGHLATLTSLSLVTFRRVCP